MKIKRSLNCHLPSFSPRVTGGRLCVACTLERVWRGKNETVARSRSRKLLCGFEPYINAKQNYTAKCSRTLILPGDTEERPHHLRKVGIKKEFQVKWPSKIFLHLRRMSCLVKRKAFWGKKPTSPAVFQSFSIFLIHTGEIKEERKRWGDYKITCLIFVIRE